MDKKIVLATSKTCGPCKLLKDRIEKLGLEVDIIDIFDNIEWTKKHGIKSVPRLVIEDGDNVEIVQGMEDIIEALKNKL